MAEPQPKRCSDYPSPPHRCQLPPDMSQAMAAIPQRRSRHLWPNIWFIFGIQPEELFPVRAGQSGHNQIQFFLAKKKKSLRALSVFGVHLRIWRTHGPENIVLFCSQGHNFPLRHGSQGVYVVTRQLYIGRRFLQHQVRRLKQEKSAHQGLHHPHHNRTGWVVCFGLVGADLVSRIFGCSQLSLLAQFRAHFCATSRTFVVGHSRLAAYISWFGEGGGGDDVLQTSFPKGRGVMFSTLRSPNQVMGGEGRCTPSISVLLKYFL